MQRKPIEAWIPVQTSKGAFSSEYAILVTCIDGTKVSLFADKSQVQEFDSQPYLRVTLVNPSSQITQTVLLPTETFETSSRWLDISNKEIRKIA